MGICTKYWYFVNSEVNFDMKTLFLHQIHLRLTIEDSKVCEISKLTLGLYFEIFWLCIPIIQNLVFRQLVPFDYVQSHLGCVLLLGWNPWLEHVSKICGHSSLQIFIWVWPQRIEQGGDFFPFLIRSTLY